MDHQIEQWERFSEAQLAEHIRHLIQTDFPALVQLLYRLDISESKLKTVLAGHPAEDAGKVIAMLIVERQQQKAAARQHFKQNGDIPEEDRW